MSYTNPDGTPLLRVSTPSDSPLHQRLAVYAVEPKTAGGSYATYWVVDRGLEPADMEEVGGLVSITMQPPRAELTFQSEPVQENVPVNLTNEILLAIVAHRLEVFQEGDLACEDNGLALAKIRSALDDLQNRTASRLLERLHQASADADDNTDA